MTIDDDLKQLVKKVKFAPSREWADSYFDLVKQVLDITELKDDNPRLVLSLPKKGRQYFPVIINSRYVIVSVENNVGLIFAPNCREIPKLRYKDELFGFRNRNPNIEPPYFLRFDNINEVVSLLDSSKKVRECWRDALKAEVDHGKASRFRVFHKSIIYKLVTDKYFRAKILDMAFPEIDTERQNDDSGGFGDPETNRKVEQAAISFVTNDYKKRGWVVDSVEFENRGFDLLCKKAKIQEHVEVKGVQLDSMPFIVTAGEVRQSHLDKYFILYVVKSALSNPKLNRFTAKEFHKKFALETISYRASLK